MLIDWFTVGAQLLNFLILMWLLHRFLYGPIIKAIDAREERIAAELKDVEAKRRAVQTSLDELETKNKTFDTERARMLEVARADAATLGERLALADRKAVADLKGQQADRLASDNLRLGREITQLVQTEVFAIARAALADLATTTLEERMTAVFIVRLLDLDASAHEAFAVAFKESAEPCIVSSRFDMPTDQRSDLQKALQASFPSPLQVRFETVSDSIGGIELHVGGQKLAWSIFDYLDTLEQKVGAAVA